MFGLGLLALVVVVISVVAGASRRRSGSVNTAHTDPTAVDGRTGGVPLVAEAIGYLGGLLTIVAGWLVLGRLWKHLATWSRLTLLGIAAAALMAVGIAIGERRGAAATRLEAFVWVLSSAALGGFTGLFAFDVLDWRGPAIASLVGAVVALQSGALWRFDDRPAQQVVTSVAVAVGAGALVAQLGGNPGAVSLVIYSLGLAALALGFARLVEIPEVQTLLGIAGVYIASMIMVGEWRAAAPLLGLATATTIGLLGMRRHDVVLEAGGLLGLVEFLPWTLVYFFHRTVGLPVVFFLVGVALLGAAVAMFRHRTTPGDGHAIRPS